MQTTGELAVRKSVTVEAPPERAFEVFTAGMAGWWPLTTHSDGGGTRRDGHDRAARGRALLRDGRRDGDEHDWGTVTAWDPRPGSPPPGIPAAIRETAQELEITFTPVDGGTRVELVHTGWERRGDDAAEKLVKTIRGGLGLVLGECYAKAV